MFLASNAAAFLSETRLVQFPDDGDIVEITPDGAVFTRADGTPVEHEPVELDWDDEGAEKGGYETFMLKEIYEQAEAVAETIGDRVRHGTLVLDGLGHSEQELKELRRIVILACGTAYHAGVVGRYVIEEWARIPVEPDIASEWIYRNPVIDENTLVIGISQSGETRDTIEAMKLAREKGARTRRDHEHDGLADHARGRLGALHALRPRGRRRRVEDLHRAGVAPLPRRAQARTDPRDDAAGRDLVHPRQGLRAAARRSTSSSTVTIRSRRSRSASPTSPSSSISAATSACRSRSRAR